MIDIISLIMIDLLNLKCIKKVLKQKLVLKGACKVLLQAWKRDWTSCCCHGNVDSDISKAFYKGVFLFLVLILMYIIIPLYLVVNPSNMVLLL